MTLTQITTNGIKDGEILNADINASAAIAKSKLASLDIVNADVNASAAIAGTKVAPNFGSQNILTTGNLSVGSSTHDRHFHVEGTANVQGKFQNNASLCLIEFEDSDTTAGIRPSFGSDANNAVIHAGGSEKLRVDSSGRLLTGGATTAHGSTNSDDLVIGANNQANQTGITLGSAAGSALRFADAANDSAGYVFYNHGTDSMTIKANSGGIGFSAGSLVATINSTGLKLESGKGINFSAYATSGNPSSNLLDDYEEGTFTPVLKASDGTTGQTSGDGRYTKVGNKVHCTIDFSGVNASGIPNGKVLQISGLPFQSGNFSETPTATTLMTYNVYYASGQENPSFYVANNSSSLFSIYSTNGGVWGHTPSDNYNQSQIYLNFSVTYFV